MPSLSRVLGWAPPDNEDYLDVALSSSPLLPLQNPTFHISEPNPIRRAPRRVTSRNFESTSPASSNSPLSSDGESPNEKRVEGHGKHADPSWVARPRNEFILFRCDYVRKHSREGKRVRRPPGAEAEKTLSKQAAEAWHHLPPEERLYWKERANGERNEHARRYPDYRYRPKKSAAGRRRQTRSSPNKQQSGSPEKVPAPNASDKEPASPTVTRHTSVADLTMNRMRPRRSVSVPELKTEPVQHRRLRSTASQGWITISNSTVGPDTQRRSSQEYLSTSTRIMSDVAQGEYSVSPAPLPRLLQASSSSLLNWNGERMVAAVPQPTQFLSSTSVSLLSGIDISGGSMLTEFTSGGNPIAPSQLFNMGQGHYSAQGDIWMPQLQSYPEEAAAPTAAGDELGSDANTQDSASDPSPLGSTVPTIPEYDESGNGVNLSSMADYGLHSTGCTPIDLPGATPEAIYSMDAEELFNLSY
ncbi:Repressor of filamentous growth 1 [Psilocybe cubensis]|uniref:HMG box domain-containing protein n=2 Tax=Psilocybe cubensis TaxID=181762 RepID=A0A8H7Y243_PSICU|nr:Repressor of filamentous growth 1 [Psilocybe cubensis]KAH9483644.1 Repressor of filamentous growth 1 [Psilocybe cubensis]